LPTARHRFGLWLAGLIWGLAEATAFFVVAGAALGGLALWWIGGGYPEAVTGFLDIIPAISPAMIDGARMAQASAPFEALLAGAFSGAPYKVFAGTAQAAGVSAPWFLLITIPARAARFVLAIMVTVVIDRISAEWLSSGARLWILAGFWIAFYALFWAVMPG
jgi:hypothetical protein